MQIRGCQSFAVFTGVVILSGCTSRMGGPSPIGDTAARLEDWGVTIKWVVEDRLDDPTKFAAIDEVFNDWGDQNFFEGVSRQERMRKDGWGRPFRWMVKNHENEKHIIVCSDGKNGIFEACAGDDISVIVKYDSRLKPKVSIRGGDDR